MTKFSQLELGAPDAEQRAGGLLEPTPGWSQRYHELV